MAFFDDHSAIKPKKFSRSFFRRWQSQVKYWLIISGLISILELSDSSISSRSTSLSPQDSESSDPHLKTLEEIDFHCCHKIFGALSNSLYDMYIFTKSVKELWDAREVKYGMDDIGLDQFIVSNFCKYAMVDFKSVSTQIYKFQFFLERLN